MDYYRKYCRNLREAKYFPENSAPYTYIYASNKFLLFLLSKNMISTYDAYFKTCTRQIIVAGR